MGNTSGQYSSSEQFLKESTKEYDAMFADAMDAGEQYQGDINQYVQFVSTKLRKIRTTTEHEHTRQVLGRILLHDIRQAYKRLSNFKTQGLSATVSRVSTRELPNSDAALATRAAQRARRRRTSRKLRVRRESVAEIKQLVLENQCDDTIQRAYKMAKLSNKHVDRGAFEKAKQKILASQKTEKKKRGALENVHKFNRVAECVFVFRVYFCAPLSQGGLFPTPMPTHNPLTGVPERWAPPIYPCSTADGQEMAAVLYYLICFSKTKKLKREEIVLGSLLEALTDSERGTWVQVSVDKINKNGTFDCIVLAHGTASLSTRDLRNLDKNESKTTRKRVRMKGVSLGHLRNLRADVPESGEGAAEYLLQVVAYEDVYAAVKTTNPWKHAYEAKRNGKSALKLARFLWRHVLSVKHPVLKAIWDVGIVGLEPEKYVNELRTQRGLPQGVEDRQEYGFSFLDTHGAIVVKEGEKLRRKRPKTAAAELAPYDGLDASLQLLLFTVFQSLDIINDGVLEATEANEFLEYVQCIDVKGKSTMGREIENGAEDPAAFRPRTSDATFRGRSLDWLRHPIKLEQPDPRVLAGYNPPPEEESKYNIRKERHAARMRLLKGEMLPNDGANANSKPKNRTSTHLQPTEAANLPAIGNGLASNSFASGLFESRKVSNIHALRLRKESEQRPMTADGSSSGLPLMKIVESSNTSEQESICLKEGETLDMDAFIALVRSELDAKCRAVKYPVTQPVRNKALYYFVTKIQRWLYRFRHKQTLQAVERDSNLVKAVKNASLGFTETAKRVRQQYLALQARSRKDNSSKKSFLPRGNKLSTNGNS